MSSINTSLFVSSRLHALKRVGKTRMIEIEIARCASVALAIVGTIGAENPLFGVAGTAGAIMYAIVVGVDYVITRRFYPFPVYRRDVIDLLDKEPLSDNPILEYLSPIETQEYWLLRKFPQQIGAYLSNVPNPYRSVAYQSLVEGQLSFKDAGLLKAPMAVGQAKTAKKSIERPKPKSQYTSPVDFLLGRSLRSALIVAVSGGGKDILLSNAIRQLLSQKPHFKVLIVDCKADPKEQGYYDVAGATVYRKNITVTSDTEVDQWCNQILDDFLAEAGQCVLVVNEGINLRRKCPRYIDVVDGLVSSGDSREMYVWEAGQSAHTVALKTHGAARSQFRAITIGMRGEELQVQAVMQARFIAPSAQDMRQVSQAIYKSPVERAWCDGLNWHPMPRLINYSGYSRDERT